MTSKLPEVWLRGPVSDMGFYLQPVAHCLLQAKEEIMSIMNDFPEHLLWERPAGLASAGFHLQHITGVLDRLLTYARGNSLNKEQLLYLQSEGQPSQKLEVLLSQVCLQIEVSIELLKQMDEQRLQVPRAVGRAKLPSTTFGLMVHAAEHTMRHVGQLLVTAHVVALAKE